MNTRTVGVVALVCGLVIAAQIGAGLLFMGGAMIHEVVQPPADGQVAIAPAPLIENFVFHGGGFGQPRGEGCNPEELKAARGPVAPVRECKITGPYSHENLSLFLVHGPD